MKNILVIGAVNIDIIGLSKTSLIPGDSNPGDVGFFVGGVGKNIADNLSRLSQNVHLCTFLGGGYFGNLIRDYLSKANIQYDHSSVNEDGNCGVYLAVHQHSGELNVAINDFSLIESVPLTFFDNLHDWISTFDMIVFDCNLRQDILEQLITRYQDKEIIVDGVSQTKVKRISKVLKYIDLLKVNKAELSSLLEHDVADIILGVKEIIEKGLKTIVVTGGKDAITYNIDKRIYQTLVFEPKLIVSSVGAGDALLSGILYGLSSGKSMHEALNYGKKCASFTMEVEEATNPLLTSAVLEE